MDRRTLIIAAVAFAVGIGAARLVPQAQAQTPPDLPSEWMRFELPAVDGADRYAWVDMRQVSAIEGMSGPTNAWRTVLHIPGGPLEITARPADTLRTLESVQPKPPPAPEPPAN